MGKKSGPKPPPPPPDYSVQIQSETQRENQRRRNQANQYNQAIRFFNQQLGGYGRELDKYMTDIEGYELGDDVSGYDDLLGKLSDYESALEGFSLGDVSGFNPYTNRPATEPTRLTFTGPNDVDKSIPNPNYQAPITYDQFGLPSTLNFTPTGTSYGQAVSYEMPQLEQLNIGLASRYTDKLNELESLIRAAQSTDKAERDRISNYFDNIVNEANRQENRINRMKLGDNFDVLLDDLVERRADVDAFDSVLDFSDKANTARDELAALEELLTGRVTAQTEAKDALRTFETERGEELDNILRTLRDADLGEYVGFDQDYGELARAIEEQLGGFETELLDEDQLASRFADERAQVSGIEDLLGGFEREKRTEQKRLEDTLAAFGVDVDQMGREIERGSMYDYYGQEQLSDSLSDLETAIAELNRRSPLNVDATEVLGRLADNRAALDGLRGQRTDALAEEGAQVAAIIGELPDIELYDESGLDSVQRRLRQELEDLNRFGGGTETNMVALESAIRQVDDRRNELAERRSAIEQDSLALLQELRNAEFFGDADVKAAADRVELVRQEQERFKAGAAADELAALDALLQGQTSRLAADAANVDARDALAEAVTESNVDAAGNLIFPENTDLGVTADQELRQFLQQTDDDELLEIIRNSSFGEQLLAGA